MRMLKDLCRRLASEEQGTELLEWVLLMGFVIVAAIGAVTVAGTALGDKWASFPKTLLPK